MADALHKGVSSYRDRHGKMRWRYRHGEVAVHLPKGPGDPDFEYAYSLARAGRLAQRSLRPAYNRRELMSGFSRDALARIKHRAGAKRVEFSLTVNDIEAQMEMQHWRCAISGIRFMVAGRSDSPFQPSLDRIEGPKGYVPGNVRIVCYIVNLAMNKWGEKPLRMLVKRMANQVRHDHWLTL